MDDIYGYRSAPPISDAERKRILEKIEKEDRDRRAWNRLCGILTETGLGRSV